jgi:hypothetical protein
MSLAAQVALDVPPTYADIEVPIAPKELTEIGAVNVLGWKI